jgi:hypothetical protein
MTVNGHSTEATTVSILTLDLQKLNCISFYFLYSANNFQQPKRTFFRRRRTVGLQMSEVSGRLTKQKPESVSGPKKHDLFNKLCANNL